MPEGRSYRWQKQPQRANRHLRLFGKRSKASWEKEALTMSLLENRDDLKELVENLNFKEKVERALALIKEAHEKYGDGLVVANSLGKDSVCVWDLAKKVSPKIRGFIVTTRFKPKETVH